MANDTGSGRNKIRQAGLVNMFKEQIFAGTNPIAIRETDPDRRNQIMLHYFCAIDGTFVDPENKDSRHCLQEQRSLFLPNHLEMGFHVNVCRRIVIHRGRNR